MTHHLTLEDLPAIMDTAQAAEATQTHPETIRRAIRRNELEAFIPRDRDPLRAGRGQGYRITKESLTSWFFHTPKEASQ